jgi:hypothetical protein
MRLEAARSGHAEVQPAHLLLAVLDRPEMHRGLRAIGVQADVYAMRAKVGAASLAPEEFRDDLPLASATEALLATIRPHEDGEPYDLLYPIALKAALGSEANRLLLRRTGVDPATLDPVLQRIR